jgi:molybdopterin synthase sulfur carrier subunit
MSGRTLNLLYFAWLRERIGRPAETLVLPDTVRTVGDLVEFLAARDEAGASAFENRRTVRCAVNQEFADLKAELHGGEEVAFFPPVTGG